MPRKKKEPSLLQASDNVYFIKGFTADGRHVFGERCDSLVQATEKCAALLKDNTSSITAAGIYNSVGDLVQPT